MCDHQGHGGCIELWYVLCKMSGVFRFNLLQNAKKFAVQKVILSSNFIAENFCGLICRFRARLLSGSLSDSMPEPRGENRARHVREDLGKVKSSQTVSEPGEF